MAAEDDAHVPGYFQSLGRSGSKSVARFLRRRQWLLRALIAAVILLVIALLLTSEAAAALFLRHGPLLEVVLALVVSAYGVYVGWAAQRSTHPVSQTAKGLLDVDPAVLALSQSTPESFTTRELACRREAVKEIARLATTVERIPSSIGLRDHPDVVRAAYERGHGLRALQARVGVMGTDVERRSIIRELLNAKELYDSGKWMELHRVELQRLQERSSAAARIVWAIAAVICFAGIISVLVLTAISMLPPTAVPITFVLGLILVPALSRLGISSDSMQQAVEVVSKAQGAMTGKSHEKKDEAKPEKAE